MYMKKRVEAIIQARMGSTRLPGKVMMDLCGKPVLWHVVERVKQAAQVDEIVVATSTKQADHRIDTFCRENGINCFRGEGSDVLSRYYGASTVYPGDGIVRITADCPLVDPHVIDEVIACYRDSSCEYASNFGEKRTYPRGLDCEIFSASLLKRAVHEATEEYEREHVTPFMYWKQERVAYVTRQQDESSMRWTLDTREDFQLIEAIYQKFYHGKHDFYTEEILAFLKENPAICKLNQNIKQKTII
jgi:spore coat polysaccharide biosynthesis protein SpsF